MRRILVGTLLVVLLTATFAAGGTASPGEVTTARNKFVTHNCTDSRMKPREIDLQCQHGDGNLEQLRWRSWGGARAKARGKYRHFPNCFPQCGDKGPFPVKVRLSRARPCDGKLHYRKVVFRFTDGKPRGVNRRERQRINCPFDLFPF